MSRLSSRTGWSYDKQLTSAAAGLGPDVVQLLSGNESSYLQLVTAPLDDRLEWAGIPAASFLPKTVSEQDGAIYGLPMFVDINFPLMYNKTLYSEAGLDAETPPATLADFDVVSSRVAPARRRRADRAPVYAPV